MSSTNNLCKQFGPGQDRQNVDLKIFSKTLFLKQTTINNNDNNKTTTKQYINIIFPERVIVENIIPRNVIINRGAAEVDNHISRDDICDYHPLRECNIYFIIPNTTLDSFFFTVCFLLDLP